ncbi:hypothetical protein H4R21_005900, partial [Coemansia helicoidea]
PGQQPERCHCHARAGPRDAVGPVCAGQPRRHVRHAAAPHGHGAAADAVWRDARRRLHGPVGAAAAGIPAAADAHADGLRTLPAGPAVRVVAAHGPHAQPHQPAHGPRRAQRQPLASV